jgi:hypothetical protein
LLAAWLLPALMLLSAPTARAESMGLSSLRVEQAVDGLYVSAILRFELPPAVEEALLKGIPITFTAQAQLYRDRWYWYDKSIITATRQLRLSYQPLTRRWRLALADGDGSAAGAGLGASASFDSLAEALQSLKRIAGWKIVDASEIELDARHNVDFRFRLDTSQLPRPMQIGITGNADWNLAVQRNVRPQ